MQIARCFLLLCGIGFLNSGMDGAEPAQETDAKPPIQAPPANHASTDWVTVLDQARAMWSRDREKALELCTRAVELAPGNPRPLMVRAAMRDAQRQFVPAINDLNEVIRLDPKIPEAWQSRGALHFKNSQFKESVSDFDQFLTLVPARRADHWQRGISLYYAGDFEAGARQFELHETVNPNDVENAVWHFLCQARAKGIEQARSGLLTPGPDSRVPMKEIHALFAGKEKPEAVVAASEPKGEDAQFYAHLYLGLYHDITGDLARATDHIAKAVAIGPNHYMGDVARVHARWLKEQSTTLTDGFGIYLTVEQVGNSKGAAEKLDLARIPLEKTPLISEKDIERFDPDNKMLLLKPEAIKRIWERFGTFINLSGKNFVAVAGGERLFLGVFVGVHASFGPELPSIFIGPPELTESFKISSPQGPAPWNDPRLKAAVEKVL